MNQVWGWWVLLFMCKMDVIRGVTGSLLCVPHAARPLLRTSIISTTRLASTALSLLPFTWWWVQCHSARCVSTNGRSTWWHKEPQYLTSDPRSHSVRPQQLDRLHWSPLHRNLEQRCWFAGQNKSQLFIFYFGLFVVVWNVASFRKHAVKMTKF